MGFILKITSCLSILLAAFLMYNLVGELKNRSIFEIDYIPFIIFFTVVSNAIVSVLLLIEKLSPKKIILIIQAIILILTSFLLYQILYNSTVSCT
ncbi:hypothetical protein CHRY9393_03244 [Chryseobacterium fistulae]|uniref:Uncharacterized protein n=1 Tax=Chryseobacterium fistulae TaxID=2675058 RepID=A0A6N4XST9_9FLAO|nr:hypothetical protein CHRY9393_03244 [Chryseobacterium fistulae]